MICLSMKKLFQIQLKQENIKKGHIFVQRTICKIVCNKNDNICSGSHFNYVGKSLVY